MKSKKIFKNIFSSFFVYAIILVLSITVSRFVILSYGSETNGLVASVNQIFQYIALLESGIGTATITAFYSPLAKRNIEEISGVFYASQKYYRKMTKWYFVCVVIVSIIWPLVLDTNLPYTVIFLFIFIQGISGVITFSYISTISNFFVASGENYINVNIHFFVTILTYILRIIICTFKLNVVFLSVAGLSINLIKCFIYKKFLNKSNVSLNKPSVVDTTLLKQKNAFLIHEISGVIFSSTDTITLSVFCSLTMASIYSVYSMVLTSINTIIGQVLNGCYFILGDAYNKGREYYIKIHDAFNSIFICLVFAIYSITYVFLLPFITLYTSGINDANYIDNKLPILFILIQILSSCRLVDNYLIKISLNAKKTVNRSLLESLINLTFSVILVQYIGIYGVLLGTIIALLYRSNDIIMYSNKKILKRSSLKEYKLYFINLILFAFVCYFTTKYPVVSTSYINLICKAALYSVCIFILFIASNIIFNYKNYKFLFDSFFLKR